MNGPEHDLIGRTAVTFLTGEARQFWEPQQTLLGTASNFCDIFWPCEFANPEIIRNFPDWRKYCMISRPDGSALPLHSAFDPVRLWQTYPQTLCCLYDGLMSALKDNDMELAAKFAGSFSHIIGDTGQIAHILDVKQVLPLFLKRDEVFLLHTFLERLDQVVCPPHEHIPRCLGKNKNEFVWALVQKLALMKRNNLPEAYPVYQALKEKDLKKARAIASDVVGRCCDLLADVLFSLWCLHTGNIPALPDRICVSDLEFRDSFCDGMFNFLPANDRIPCPEPGESLPADIGEGPGRGVALLPPLFPNCSVLRDAWADYPLPSGVFRTVSFACGLNKASLNQTDAVFKIILDGKSVWESPAMGKDSAPVHAEVPLGTASSMRLYVRDIRDIRDAAETKFFYPVYQSVYLCR